MNCWSEWAVKSINSASVNEGTEWINDWTGIERLHFVSVLMGLRCFLIQFTLIELRWSNWSDIITVFTVSTETSNKLGEVWGNRENNEGM